MCLESHASRRGTKRTGQEIRRTIPDTSEMRDCIEITHDVLPKRVKRARRSRVEQEENECVREKEEEQKKDVVVENAQDADVVDGLIRRVENHGVCDDAYEYLDHTADVQLHSWGDSLEESFENLALCMFNYMTPLKGILETCLSGGKKNIKRRTFSMSGSDMESLVYHWLDELLFQFSTGFFVPVAIQITELNLESWTIQAVAIGDVFDTKVHACGTEIKAITYSAMQIYTADDDRKHAKGKTELYVIVDI